MLYYNQSYRRLHVVFFVALSLVLPYVLQAILMDKVLDSGLRALFVAVCWIILWTLAYFSSSKAFIKRLTRQNISIYNDQCEPERFLLSSSHIMRKIKQPYDPWNVWYLSYCCLAYCDTGDEDEAKKILRAILDDITQTKKKQIRAQKELRVLSSVAALMDKSIVLEYLDSAETFFLEKPRKYSQDLLHIAFQRKLIYAERIGAPYEIIEAWEQSKMRTDYPLRIKVIAAYKQSVQYRKLGDMEKELDLLEYVIDNGRRLSVGKEAIKRLKTLNKITQMV